ncbi:MAG TPA: S8 family serine peptidase [Nevskiaceae bacterium]|nr:S8 family serine peptidase [Nevskiaceae bacterium]
MPALLLLSSFAAKAEKPIGAEITSLRAIAAAALLPSSASPLVAVLDTSFEVLHPSLVTKLVPGYNVFTGGVDVGLKMTDSVLYTHGTAVAGIITGDPLLSIWPRAVYPSARILPVKICCADSSGQTDSNLLRQGILYAAGIRNDYGLASPERAAVINVSYVMSNMNDPGLVDAIRQANEAGSIVITALGESTPQISQSMAGLSGIVGVVTASAAKSLPITSEPMPIIPAPGTNLFTVMPSGTPLAPIPDWAGVTGSSFATAVASAVAAMVIAANPNLSPGDVAKILSSPQAYDAEGLDAVLAVQMADTLPLPPTQGSGSSSGGGSSPSSSGGSGGGSSGGGALDGMTLWFLMLPALFATIWRRQRR